MTDSDCGLNHAVSSIRTSFASSPPELPQIQRLLQLCRSKLGTALEELDSKPMDQEKLAAIDQCVGCVFEEVDLLCEAICDRS
jgi:hypothetical protein